MLVRLKKLPAIFTVAELSMRGEEIAHVLVMWESRELLQSGFDPLLTEREILPLCR